MFDNNDTVFINWIENLEAKCQDLIFSKGQSWFETKLEKDDIETAFTSPFKIFKSGKYYLLRVNVKQNIRLYDENDQTINIEDITHDKTIISILEIQGIKFTSRNFQIEIELKQSMVVSPDPFLDTCFIKKPHKKQNVKEDDIDYENTDINLVKSENHLKTFINETAQDLALAKNTLSLDKTNNNNNNNNIKPEPINLEISFENQTQNNNEKDLELEEANIVLDVEEIITEPELEEIDDPNILKEFDLSSTLENNLESITLKKPNQVYYEIYQKARDKAKEAKKNALVAYLEMKNIKKTYMLDDIDDSDSEFDDFASKDSDTEISDTESLED